MHVPHDDVSKYGIVDARVSETGHKVKDMVEKPTRTRLRYCHPREIHYYPRIFVFLKTQSRARAENKLTVLKRLSEEEPVYAYDLLARYDVATGLISSATVEFALERNDLKKDFAAYCAGLQQPSAVNKH